MIKDDITAGLGDQFLKNGRRKDEARGGVLQNNGNAHLNASSNEFAAEKQGVIPKLNPGLIP